MLDVKVLGQPGPAVSVQDQGSAEPNLSTATDHSLSTPTNEVFVSSSLQWGNSISQAHLKELL